MVSVLETNIFEGQLPSSFTCSALSVVFPKLADPDSKGEFQRSLYRAVRRRMSAFVYGERIYFLGKEEELREDLQPLLNEYNDFKIAGSVLATLKLPLDIDVIRNLLYSSFEDFLTRKGYVVRFRHGRDKVAIPSFETLKQDEHEYKLIEYTGAQRGVTVCLIDGFFYRLNIAPNGKVDLVIDPKIQVLIPFNNVSQDVLERSYLSVICLHDSDQRGGCQLLQRNSVKYVGPAEKNGLPETKCVSLAKQFCEVTDVKKQENLILPANILFVEGHPAALGIYALVRRRSLKDSQSRRLLTSAFAKHLATEGADIEVPFGRSSVRISSSPVSLPVLDGVPNEPMSQARILGEPKLVFTNSPMYVSPRDGLMAEGPYSRNNSRTSHHPETITLHVIYPKSNETQYKAYVEKLSSGCPGYPGFHSSAPPFYSDMKPLYYPLTNGNLISYKSEISLIRDKVERRNHVVFVILPDEFTAYVDLKSLCYQHGIASQFIREETITNSSKAWSLQYYLWNIAIALYAKAGGTPWRIDSSLLEHTDCYLGIQTKIHQEGRAGPNAFFVGAADIFNSLGEYISCAVHQGMSRSIDGLHVDSEFMKNLVVNAVDRYKTNVGPMPKRIIVHRLLDFDKAELAGLQQGLEQSGADCPCILVHLQEGHHFRGYLLGGDLIADRSTYYPLGKRSVVLFTTGKTQGRYEGGLGTPKPIQINVKMLNSNEDVDYGEIEKLCNSVLGFTRLRWNTTRIGVRHPLTTFAADKIGEMAKSGFTNLQYRDIRDFL